MRRVITLPCALVGAACPPPVLAAFLMLAACETPAAVPLESTTGEPSRALKGTSETKLTAGDAAAADAFGRIVSINGVQAIVGALGDDGQTGAAYVFRRTGMEWTQEAKLTASDGAVGDFFGLGVSIHGALAIVGAQGDDDQGTDAGSTYVFRRTGNGWSQEAKLTASDAAAGAFFGGEAVSIDGNLAIVGAFGSGGSSGSAYVFRRTAAGWIEEAKLTASDAAGGAEFGRAVWIDAQVAIVGANRAGGTGAAYVFRRTEPGWIEEAKLTANDAASGDAFGAAVAIHDGLAIIGAPVAGGAAGAAYVFRRSETGWSQEAKLTASDAAAIDFFGLAVSIHNRLAIVGSPFDDDGGGDAGSAYVFGHAETGWTQLAKLTASDAGAGDLFGVSVSVHGAQAIIGATFDDDGGTDAGSAYVFRSVGREAN